MQSMGERKYNFELPFQAIQMSIARIFSQHQQIVRIKMYKIYSFGLIFQPYDENQSAG